MSKSLNPMQVRRAFGLASANYDRHAVVQREIGDRLLQHMAFTKIEPQRILDIGCGTGYFTRLLRQRFRRADIIGLDLALPMALQARKQQPRRRPWQGRTRFLVGDACLLPFADASFDLVCSNLAMQWVSTPEIMMREMRRVLAPGGLMLFSTFGRRTLEELRQNLARIDPAYEHSVLRFPDVIDLGDALMQLSVASPVTDTDLITVTYPNVYALIRELKGLGASASAIARPVKGLYGRRLLRELERCYPRNDTGRIQASFEALYAQAWFKEDALDGMNCIPIRAA